MSRDALFSHMTLFVVSHDAILYFVVFCMCIYWIFSVEMINLGDTYLKTWMTIPPMGLKDLR